MAESQDVVKQVMQATGESYEKVSILCTTAHETVDECLADDISVVAPPLVVGRLGCPVLDRLLLRLGDGQWQLPESVDVTQGELAEALMLPIETVAAYPLVGRFGLLARILDRLGIQDVDAERYLAMLDAWLATYEGEPRPGESGRHGRRPHAYEVWPLPNRDAFEGWLLARTDVLWKEGFAVRLADESLDDVNGQGHLFVDGRRADLVMRFTQDCECGSAGDWLVIENKTTAVGIRALDQLAMSVDWLRAEARPGNVHGLLIADGVSLEVERGLRERSFHYLSMATIGYRRWVRVHSPLMPDPGRDATAISYPANIPVRSLTPADG